MNLSATLLLSFIIISFSITGFCQNPVYDPAHLYSVNELQKDFQFLRIKLEKKHPDLYSYTSKAEMNLFFDSLYKSIVNPSTEMEFYNLITLLNSKIKDGHTMLLPGGEATSYLNQHTNFFPFYIIISNGKLYVNMNCSSDTAIKEGAEIQSINGVSASNILHYLLIRQIHDGNNETYPAWILTNYFKEYFSFSFGHPGIFSISYKERNAGAQIITVNALTKDSIRVYKQARYSNRIPGSSEKQGLILDINNQANIATLTIKSFDNRILKSLYKQDFENTIKKVFTQINNKQVHHLIIDIRDNQGGNFEPGRLLLSYLLQQPVEYLENSNEHRTIIPAKNNYTGNLYVLINGGSFSNSGIVSSYLELTKRAVFIGEETAGNKNKISGNPSGFILPNTKIVAEISKEKYVIRQNPDDGHGVVPAYYIIPAIDDVIHNKDTVKEFVLNLILKAKP